jgi:hypothetical protein
VQKKPAQDVTSNQQALPRWQYRRVRLQNLFQESMLDIYNFNSAIYVRNDDANIGNEQKHCVAETGVCLSQMLDTDPGFLMVSGASEKIIHQDPEKFHSQAIKKHDALLTITQNVHC